jgi:hypothetical protein
MMLSAVVPGGGQFYSKTYVAGITWMSAVVLAAVVTLLAARTEFLAGLGAMGLLLMVWVNNVRDARDCAVASVRRARSKS